MSTLLMTVGIARWLEGNLDAAEDQLVVRESRVSGGC